MCLVLRSNLVNYFCEMEKKTIAILLTCHNRREKTLVCLEAFYNSILPQDYSTFVYLVDDGSTDGTSDDVKFHFPQVKIIQGTGNLFWSKGMRLAWETAAHQKNHDFYLWLNDDTILAVYALAELLECYQESVIMDNQPAIIAGACRDSVDTNKFSYGGHTEQGPVIPNGELQVCKYINGNATLVSKEIYENLGNISSEYTHTMGDFDYGLRAIQAGFNNYTTKRYVGICAMHDDSLEWFYPKMPLMKRWKHMHSTKGLNLKEYIHFRRKFWGWRWIIYAFKAYSKVIFPSFYNRLKGEEL